MALNQTIVSPLTNIKGSISSFTSPSGSVLQIVSSSLPAYQATGWQYKILPFPIQTVSNIPQNATDLRLTLANSKKYIINGYLLGSSTLAANGLRIGVATANVETYYAIEVPSTATLIAYGFNAPVNAASAVSTGLNDYQLILIRAIAITAASGVPTFTPTFYSENANTQAVNLGPSVLYYREY
jgi:hypothetical protein